MSLFGELYSDIDLPTRARIVYMNLKDRADKDGGSFPSLGKISSDTGLSKRTVQRAIDDLIKHKYLQKEKRFRGNNATSSNYYKLLK